MTRHEDCVTVNRDAQRFSSYRNGTFLWETPEDQLEQQRLMMVTMDPPLHTRYRRLVNKGFTPRMIGELQQSIHGVADEIIDRICEAGSADFVIDVAAELPLVVLAELLGVPPEDRSKMFDWSNRMIGREDAEYQGNQVGADENAGLAAAELFGYAAELYEQKRASPGEDLMSVLTQVELDGEQLSELELDLFFMLLAVAGNETTRNLMSGAMVAFSQFPDQWERLRDDRSLLPVGGGGDAALRHAGHELPAPGHRGRGDRRPDDQRGRQGRLLPRLGQPRRDGVRGPGPVRRGPETQSPYRVRGWGPALLPGCQPGPHGDHRDVRAPPRPPPRPRRWTGRSSACSRTSSTG